MKMTSIIIFLIFIVGFLHSAPRVIIKADDFRGLAPAWEKFLAASRAQGVKVSIGIIVEPVVGKSDVSEWLKKQEALGDVEFWNHGWDHKKWTVANAPVSEFFHSGIDHQRDHLSRSQDELKNLLGHDCTVLGTPFNGRDDDTLKALDERQEIKLFFLHFKASDIDPKSRIKYIDIISENDGTGKPNAQKFQETWSKLSDKTQPISLQFHPPYFDDKRLEEYEAILKYLIAEGCSIILPKELL
jgi:peptidoglycan/xylan/chitin deacetylase (PgdA/CDA1 family)